MKWMEMMMEILVKTTANIALHAVQYVHKLVSDIDVFALKRDVKLQPTNHHYKQTQAENPTQEAVSVFM